MDPIVTMKGIQKRFGEVRAIRNGQFDLFPGEIHSVIGENGAGKSTMMKILYGLYQPDAGEITVRGNRMEAYTPKDALAMGIGMVHQEFMLVQEMTVLENIILGFEPGNAMRIDFEQARKKIDTYIQEYHMDIQLDKKIRQISVGEAQRVEIIKTLYRGAEIIILDEPTAVLTPQESEKLFEILKVLKDDGKSVVFISHKLKEIMEVSDRITVMRQGEFIDTVAKEHTSIPELSRLMVGRDVFLNISKKKGNPGKTVLKLDKIWVPGEKELSKIRDFSMEVREGEIVGVAGIDGNGQTELIEAITGLRKVERGAIYLKEEKIQNCSPRKIRRKGISHVPENRNYNGLNKSFSIQDNLIAVALDGPELRKGILNDRAKQRQYAQRLIQTFDIRPADPQYCVGSLSGGNAQKIVIGREVDTDSSLLIAAQPSRGVDIGAIESIRKILLEERDKGRAILLVSTDLEEVLSLSDRIVVLYEGHIAGEFLSDEVDEERLGLLMLGGEETEDAKLG